MHLVSNTDDKAAELQEEEKTASQSGQADRARQQSDIERESHFEAVYDELRRIARQYLARERSGHTLQPTALVHEAYLRLADQKAISPQDGAHLRALAARQMRLLLIDHARRRSASKRGGAFDRITLATDLTPPVVDREIDILDLEEALSELNVLDPRLVQVVELRYFGGLTIDEISGELGISATVVKEDWRLARAFLSSKLGDQK